MPSRASPSAAIARGRAVTWGMRLRSTLVLGMFVVGCGGGEPASPDAGPGNADAADPLVLLTATLEEPPGANCVDGGTAVVAGLDVDRDGTLDADEITATTYVCAPAAAVIDGDVTVSDAPALRALDGVTAITGTLTIDAPALATVDLTTLVHVGALDVVHATAGAAIELPALRGVDGAFIVGSDAGVGTVAAPQLRRAGATTLALGGTQLTLPALTAVDQLDILGDNLTQIDLPALTTCAQLLRIRGDAVTNVDLSALQSADLLLFSAGLSTLALPALRNVGILSLGLGMPTTTVSAPQLTTARSVFLFGLTQLSSLDLTSLQVVQTLNVSDTQLASFALPQLTVATSMTVTGNALLDNCEPLLVVAGASVDDYTIGFNDDTTCACASTVGGC